MAGDFLRIEVEMGLKIRCVVTLESTVLDRTAEVANVGSIQLIVDMVVDVRKIIWGGET